MIHAEPKGTQRVSARRLAAPYWHTPAIGLRPKGLRFQEVVSERLGKLGNPVPASTDTHVQQGQAATLWLKARAEGSKRADKRRRSRSVLTSGGEVEAC